MIKVLHIISDLNTAGAQTVVMNYFRYLNNDPDLDMAILVNGKPCCTPYEKEAEEKGYRVIFSNYQPITTLPFISGLLNWFRFQHSLYKVLSNAKPDIIHTHGTALLSFVSIPAMLAGIKVRVHTLHSDPYAVRESFARWAKKAFYKFGFYPVCVTEGQAKKAVERYGIKEYTVIKNGVDSRRFKDSTVGKAVRAQLGISEKTTIIGCVGRFDKIKNHSFLIELYAEYVKNTPDSLLMLVGNGGERGNIEKKAKECGIYDKVVFTGLCNDVERYYYAMDLFMLTSFFESSSIVTVEAQFAGKRCVVSSSIPESVVVTDKVNRIPLDAPVATWLAAMRDELPHDKPVGTLEDFSMDNAARMLKDLYYMLYKAKTEKK